jgi:pyruvate ferredoxin oxidoreductase alpha subunit
MVSDGELDAEFICVESEHSAMSACLGSSAVGARTFTATAGQGLELMHEVLYVASSCRLPVVMAVANRAVSGPLNVWGDHSDVMATRDCGWIQIFAENGQEAFDLTLCAFRIAEDPKVLFPTMVHVDGFHLSHMIEPIYLLDQEEVNKFLPRYKYPFPLDPDRPVTMGAFAPPVLYTEAKKAQEEALQASREVIRVCFEEFARLFGRQYSFVENYRSADAEVLLLMMGSFSETAMTAVDKLRNNGLKTGLIRPRLWRPFPYEELRKSVSHAKLLIVFDRCLSYGGMGGPVASEVKSALYAEKNQLEIVSFVGGLGGRDVTPEEFEQVIKRGMEQIEKGIKKEYEIIGVRE